MNDWELVYNCSLDPRFEVVEERIPLLEAHTLKEAQAAGWREWMRVQPEAHARWERWQATLGKEAPRFRFGVMCPLPRVYSHYRQRLAPLDTSPPSMARVHHLASV